MHHLITNWFIIYFNSLFFKSSRSDESTFPYIRNIHNISSISWHNYLNTHKIHQIHNIKVSNTVRELWYHTILWRLNIFKEWLQNKNRHLLNWVKNSRTYLKPFVPQNPVSVKRIGLKHITEAINCYKNFNICSWNLITIQNKWLNVSSRQQTWTKVRMSEKLMNIHSCSADWKQKTSWRHIRAIERESCDNGS